VRLENPQEDAMSDTPPNIYPRRSGPSTRRQRAHEILDISLPHDKAGRLVDTGLIVLIALNVLAVIFETLPDISET
jgi:hypothetical protein